MVKLQKQVSRKRGNTEYFKYVVTVPTSLVKQEGLEVGDEVEISLKKIKNPKPYKTKK